jgi:multiple sugar transport system substrate-binding protein
MYGSAEQRNQGWGYGWWMARYVSKAAPWMPFWDENMTPLINSAEGIKATEQYVETVQFSHPDILSWSFTETVGLMAAGQAATDVRWPFLSFFVQGPDSQVKGKIAYALPPGDEIDGQLNRRAIMQFGTSCAVNAHSKNPELAYLFLQWLNSPEKGPLVRGATTGFADASVRWNDVDNEALQAKYPPEYFAISLDLAQITTPEPSIPGANEYIDILDRNLQEAAQGSKTPKEAMDAAAAGWDDVTDRLGRENQMEVWQQFLEIAT